MEGKERGFFVFYGFIGRVEFESYGEAMEQCIRANQAGIYDSETMKLMLNDQYRPDLCDPEIRYGKEKNGVRINGIEMVMYLLTALLVACMLMLLRNVR